MLSAAKIGVRNSRWEFSDGRDVIPYCFGKCAEAILAKGVGGDFARPVCTKSAEAIELKGTEASSSRSPCVCIQRNAKLRIGLASAGKHGE